MRNPYTGEEMRHLRPHLRADVDYAFLGVMVVGVLSLAVYGLLPLGTGGALLVSATLVSFLYFFLGGYGFARARRQRSFGDAATNRDIALVLIVVALWDVASPIALRDASAVALFLHAVGGGVALLLALVAYHAEEARALVPEAAAPGAAPEPFEGAARTVNPAEPPWKEQ